MAKKSAIETNKNRAKKVAALAHKRSELKAVVRNRALPLEERFAAQLRLSALPRNSASTRLRNRCALSGRPRGYYRKFGLSRIALRELALAGKLPGVVKSSW